ncbi:hypothetical protein C8Q80DRAFT_1265504 [Daedaleopsis nitida]|nr:hypothetical protein C8Q80DRAFT_1265504 [Daedaleopsis nitida]
MKSTDTCTFRWHDAALKVWRLGWWWLRNEVRRQDASSDPTRATKRDASSHVTGMRSFSTSAGRCFTRRVAAIDPGNGRPEHCPQSTIRLPAQFSNSPPNSRLSQSLYAPALASFCTSLARFPLASRMRPFSACPPVSPPDQRNPTCHLRSIALVCPVQGICAESPAISCPLAHSRDTVRSTSTSRPTLVLDILPPRNYDDEHSVNGLQHPFDLRLDPTTFQSRSKPTISSPSDSSTIISLPFVPNTVWPLGTSPHEPRTTSATLPVSYLKTTPNSLPAGLGRRVRLSSTRTLYANVFHASPKPSGTWRARYTVFARAGREGVKAELAELANDAPPHPGHPYDVARPRNAIGVCAAWLLTDRDPNRVEGPPLPPPLAGSDTAEIAPAVPAPKRSLPAPEFRSPAPASSSRSGAQDSPDACETDGRASTEVSTGGGGRVLRASVARPRPRLRTRMDEPGGEPDPRSTSTFERGVRDRTRRS